MKNIKFFKKTIVVKESKRACSGATPALGHPRVYIDLQEGKETVCPYCNQAFLYKKA